MSHVRSHHARRIGLACVLALAGSVAFAQVHAERDGLRRLWPADCAGTATLNNATGFPVGALWIAIGDNDRNDPAEVATITVHDVQGGRTWDVDDDEDEDNDDPGEGDDVDATPRGEPTGWHRVQARGDADVFAPGERITVTLCDENGGSLAFRPIAIVMVAEATGAVGGDGGRQIISASEVPIAASIVELTIFDSASPPVSTPDFSFSMVNHAGVALDGVVVTAPQVGPDVIDVSSGGGGTYDGPSGFYNFPSPLQPLSIAQIDLSLDQLDVSGETVIQLVNPEAVPALGTLGLLALAGGALLLGAWLVARRGS